MPLRDIMLLVITPSVSARKRWPARFRHRLPRSLRLRRSAASEDPLRRRGLLSYLLFDSGFCSALIDLGYRDAQAKRDELATFLSVRSRVRSEISDPCARSARLRPARRKKVAARPMSVSAWPVSMLALVAVRRELAPPDRQRDDHAGPRLVGHARVSDQRAAIVEHAHWSPSAMPRGAASSGWISSVRRLFAHRGTPAGWRRSS